MTATQSLLRMLLSFAILSLGPTDADGAQAPDRVRSVTTSIETAFTKSNARSLRDALPRRGKIRIAFRTLAIDEGYYGREQVVVLFQRLFDARETLDISFQPPDPHRRRDRQIVLTALWRYRTRANPSSQIRLEFTLAPLDSDLWVREIRELK
jgi:hypothetical protein